MWVHMYVLTINVIACPYMMHVPAALANRRPRIRLVSTFPFIV